MSNAGQKKRAFVTGISGQDGAYLAQALLRQGYEVIGGVRRSSTTNYWRLEELGILNNIKLVTFDLLEDSNIVDVIKEVRPSTVFNLGAQSFVAASFRQPLLTTNIDAMGTLRLLEAIRTYCPETRFYQASTSEMYGKIREPIQNETTPFNPRSPYAAAKLFAHFITVNYREAYGLHASSGILFNHESPLRGREFVTRKITSQLALIQSGKANILEIGNMNAKRDWGHARDFVEGMLKMTEADEPDDYVLATGVTTSVRDFVSLAGRAAGFDLTFEGAGIDEKAIDRRSGKTIVQVNREFFRPSEVDVLIGDPSKAKAKLGWKPITTLAQLTEEMVRSDAQRLASGKDLY